MDEAAPSRRMCSEEDLNKALADLDQLVSRCPIPDEFKIELPGADAESDEKKAAKKKKLYRLSPEDVRMMLSYECEPIAENKAIHKLAEREKGIYEDGRIAVSILQVFQMHWQDNIRETQEWMRNELRTKGYVAYEATDDEEEEEKAAPARHGARGRRRHRPGVTKPAGGRGAKKIN